MDIIYCFQDLKTQLIQALSTISKEQFAAPVPVLQQSSIGKHLRHSIEMFQELITGYNNGLVHYAGRKRDLLLETDLDFAISVLEDLAIQLPQPDKMLLLTDEYALISDRAKTVETSYYRELIYNFDHTVHHMALMRIALEYHFQKTVASSFGVAVSTLQYQQTCVR